MCHRGNLLSAQPSAQWLAFSQDFFLLLPVERVCSAGASKDGNEESKQARDVTSDETLTGPSISLPVSRFPDMFLAAKSPGALSKIEGSTGGRKPPPCSAPVGLSLFSASLIRSRSGGFGYRHMLAPMRVAVEAA